MKIIKLMICGYILINFGVYAQTNYNYHKIEDYSKDNYSIVNKCPNSYDPFIKFNRHVFKFNDKFDRVFLKPLSKTYRNITNNYTRQRVNNFTSNLKTPLTVVNYALQGNINGTFKSLWRFIINSTFGIGGLFDVATKFGIDTQNQTLGSTFAHYGIPPGPYLILPFLGSTNLRDVTDSVYSNYALNPLQYHLHTDFKIAVTTISVISNRENLLDFSDYLDKNAIDPYISVREAYHQNREYNVHYPDHFKCPVAYSY